MRSRTQTIVLMLARTFSWRHRKSRQDTCFAESVLNGNKLHTIRSDYDAWKHSIDKVRNGKFFLSLRQWSGPPGRSIMSEIAELKYNIGYERIEMRYSPDTGALEVSIEGVEYDDVQTLANNEGMTLDDFTDWFFGQGTERTVFEGVIVHFTGFRYALPK